MLYFAYGSNMSIKRMQGRIRSASFVCVASLRDHDLRFHKKSNDGSGKCDISKTEYPEHSVFGVVFDIAEEDKSKLDNIEGLGQGYEQKEVTVITSLGTTISAMTYYATRKDSNLRPYHWYKFHVLTGARENKLPKEYIEKINRVVSIDDPKMERHEREMAIYVNDRNK